MRGNKLAQNNSIQVVTVMSNVRSEHALLFPCEVSCWHQIVLQLPFHTAALRDKVLRRILIPKREDITEENCIGDDGAS